MSIFETKIRECEIPHEDFVSIPVHYFEDLIRAETERDILEIILTSDKKCAADDVLKAIQTAREKHHRGVLSIEVGACPCSCEESDAAGTNTAACYTEVSDEAEACM